MFNISVFKMFHNAIFNQLIELFSDHFYLALTSPPTSWLGCSVLDSSPTNWSDCLSLHRQLRLGRTRWEFSIIITIGGNDSAP